VAIFRNRVIHPEDDDDDEQARSTAARLKLSGRTMREWRRRYRDGEIRYGSGYLGLLPSHINCGGGRKLTDDHLALIHGVLTDHFDTHARRLKRGSYGEYLLRCGEKTIEPTTETTFYAESKYHKRAYDQEMARGGSGVAYKHKDYYRGRAYTTARHGSYAWAMGYLDHTPVPLRLRDETGEHTDTCWLSMLILGQPRRIAAFYLSFDPPSYRSCMMVLRLCVKRFGRLPTAITVDGGPEFKSIYFERFLALYRVRKHRRPRREPRFGSVQERLFETMDTELTHHLLGNIPVSHNSRTDTKKTDPRRQAVWTLARFAARVQKWADEEYDTIPHPALSGLSPRAAYEASMQRDGGRQHKTIPYDNTFKMATFPTTAKRKAMVQPTTGVRINYIDYWCEEMRDARVEKTTVGVCYDPFDVSVAYAYINKRWRLCRSIHDADLAGCSERELPIITEDLHRRNKRQHGRERVEITQKQLAMYRRENMVEEALLLQQRHDRETKAAFTVLEGGRSVAAVDPPAASQGPPADEIGRTGGASAATQRDTAGQMSQPRPSEKEPDDDTLLVFKRTR